MRQLFIVLAVILAGWFFYDRVLKPAPPPPPPPPPPVTQLPPAPALKPEELEKILESTTDMEPAVRLEAAKLLADIRAPQARTALYELLSRDTDAGVRRSIVSLLEKQPGPDTTKRLVTALQDPDPDVRVAVLQLLAKIGDFSTASAISDALKDTDERVRLQALKTLNALQQKRTAEILAQQERERQAAQQAQNQSR